MCGITGIWEYGAAVGRVGVPLIEAMRDTLVHRGPDDAGVLIFDEGRGGFGFRRLSIIDLTPAGHQPMRGCDGRDVWLVFNGEIYNHADLRTGLEERGHRYVSSTDSETIVHLYEERGVDFVDALEGDFAIAIWDGDRGELSVYRDRLGVKPLYYYAKNGCFIFGSEIKAILAHPGVERDVNHGAVSDYLTFLTTPAPQTLFQDIKKLPAGHRLTVNRSGDVRVDQYWDVVPNRTTENRTEAEHCDEVMRLLRSSIRKRMMSDVPFGVFLSGGVDSSANVALMSELMDRPVSTFTVGYSDDATLNELESAKRVAAMFGTDHHEVIIGEREVSDLLSNLFYHLDEPLADPVCVPLYYVAKLAHDSGTTVVQTGEGADEIFAGYDKYVSYLRIYETLWRHAERAPSVMRRALAASATPIFAATRPRRMASELIRRFGAGEPLFWGAAVVFDEQLKQEVLSREFSASLDGHSTLNLVERHLAAHKTSGGDFLSEMIYLELKIRLPELLLARIDRMTMAHSVEARVPFLDHHLVEYAATIPRELKIAGSVGKHILKRALEPILPHDLLYADKRGFGPPVRAWFRAGLAAELREHILNSTMVSRGFLDYARVTRMLDEHKRGDYDWSFHLWALLNLSLWYERWIDPR